MAKIQSMLSAIGREEDERPLRGILGALRKPRDEAQLTQVIAAAARSDQAFAARLLRALVDAAPHQDRVDLLGTRPPALRCEAEVQVHNPAGKDCGRVDLAFYDDEGSFCVFAELKLASDYGDTQLERYLDALDARPEPRRGLLAATTLMPQLGEECVERDSRWVGSVRWYDVVETLWALDHRHAPVHMAWQAWLELLRQEGDFGPMDFDPRDIEGWARRDQAEEFLFPTLNELAKPTEALLRDAIGGSAADQQAACLLSRGKYGSAVVVPWKNKPNVQYAVPANLSEQRFRIEFLATGGGAYFTVEARYEHPKESLDEDEAVGEATTFLRGHDFDHGNDGDGYYWARVFPASEWLYEGTKTTERLLGLIGAAIPRLGESGIFRALQSRTPSTPAEPGPPEETSTVPQQSEPGL